MSDTKLIRRSYLYKGMDSEILGDAPFLGARLLAPTCICNCPGCFNQHIYGLQNIVADAATIIDQVKSNPLHQGIIFGGLEWTENYEAMYEITEVALQQELQVMVYTHWSEEDFIAQFPEYYNTFSVWYKFGDYQKDVPGYVDPDTQITLASKNQRIVHHIVEEN